MSTNKHDDWLKNVVRNFPRAELVEDVLALLSLPMKPRNADYFFENRRLVGELKSLLTSRVPLLQALIDELREKGELPIFYHDAPISEVIKDHPDRKRLNRHFLMEISKTLEKDFRDANSQIRETKIAFNLHAAKGFILVTNSELPEMTPKLAWNELSRLIMRKRGNAFVYEHIDFAIYIQDVEVREFNNNYAEHPVLISLREEDEDILAFVKELLRSIAKAKRFDFREYQGDVQQVLDSTIPHKRFATIPPLTRSGVWKRRYLETRIYRELSNDELVCELARFMLEDFLTLKDGEIAPNTTAPNRDYLGEKLEGLFTECELRFIDMRKLQKQMNLLLDKQTATGAVAEFLRQRKTAT
jgi:hypothetical protein